MFGLLTLGAAAVFAEEHMTIVYCVIVDVYCAANGRLGEILLINNDIVKDRRLKKRHALLR